MIDSKWIPACHVIHFEASPAMAPLPVDWRAPRQTDPEIRAGLEVVVPSKNHEVPNK